MADTSRGELRSSDGRIAVVIPAHDYEEYLGEAVASVLSQTRPPDEIVIVDDGSADRTADIVDALTCRHPDLIVAICHAEAKGPNAARNAGVRASSGDLVVTLDADDRLSPRYLELLARALNQGADFAYGATKYFGTVDNFVAAKPFDARRLRRNNLLNVSAMFPRRLFEELGGFATDLDLIGLEDWDFWQRAAAIGARGVPVDGAWLEYRQHGGSRGGSGLRRLLRAHFAMWRRGRGGMTALDLLSGLVLATAWSAFERLRMHWTRWRGSPG